MNRKMCCIDGDTAHFLWTKLNFTKHSVFDQVNAMIEHLTDRSFNTELFTKFHYGACKHINLCVLAIL